MDLTQNYFELFGLQPSFSVNLAKLADSHRALQKEFHPDKFASKSAAESRLSVQVTSLLNEAHSTLKSPLKRAEYLLSLAGKPLNKDTLTINDMSFLMKQMEWREALAELDAAVKSQSGNVAEQLGSLFNEVQQERQSLIDSFEQNYTQQQWQQAVQVIAELHFIEKMCSEIENLEEKLLG